MVDLHRSTIYYSFTNMKNLVICLTISTSLLSACKKDCPSRLEFYLPLQAYGIKDTLYLGDTLRIRLDIPDNLAEINSGNTYDFVDYNFKLITYIEKIDTLPIGIDSDERFDWATVKGESISNGESFRVLPTYADHTYHYEVIITPKRKGLFIFGMNSIASRGNELQKLDGPCSERPVNVYPRLENDTNTNFEFLKFSPDPAYVNLDRERFDNFAGFCFFVK